MVRGRLRSRVCSLVQVGAEVLDGLVNLAAVQKKAGATKDDLMKGRTLCRLSTCALTIWTASSALLQVTESAGATGAEDMIWCMVRGAALRHLLQVGAD
jgi:hypothetical protein